MKTKVTFSGGFHNSGEMNLVIDFDEKSYNDYVNGIIDKYELIEDNASETQLRWLKRHFCCIKGCTCGSWHRANIELA